MFIVDVVIVVGGGTTVDVSIVFEVGIFRCCAEGTLLSSSLESRSIGDNSGVKLKLCGDRLAIELCEDGICIGLVLFQQSVLGLSTVRLMLVGSRYAGSCCIRDLIDLDAKGRNSSPCGGLQLCW